MVFGWFLEFRRETSFSSGEKRVRQYRPCRVGVGFTHLGGGEDSSLLFARRASPSGDPRRDSLAGCCSVFRPESGDSSVLAIV